MHNICRASARHWHCPQRPPRGCAKPSEALSLCLFQAARASHQTTVKYRTRAFFWWLQRYSMAILLRRESYTLYLMTMKMRISIMLHETPKVTSKPRCFLRLAPILIPVQSLLFPHSCSWWTRQYFPGAYSCLVSSQLNADPATGSSSRRSILPSLQRSIRASVLHTMSVLSHLNHTLIPLYNSFGTSPFHRSHMDIAHSVDLF